MSPAVQSPTILTPSILPTIVTGVPLASATIVILLLSSIVTVVIVNGVGMSLNSPIHFSPLFLSTMRKLNVPSSLLCEVIVYVPSTLFDCAKLMPARYIAQSSAVSETQLDLRKAFSILIYSFDLLFDLLLDYKLLLNTEFSYFHFQPSAESTAPTDGKQAHLGYLSSRSIAMPVCVWQTPLVFYSSHLNYL